RDLQLRRGRVIWEGPERILTLEVLVYQRTAGNAQGAIFPVDYDGNTSWDGRRLQLVYPGRGPGRARWFTNGPFSLDVTFNENDPSWIGTYTRDGITKQIRLDRPGV